METAATDAKAAKQAAAKKEARALLKEIMMSHKGYKNRAAAFKSTVSLLIVVTIGIGATLGASTAMLTKALPVSQGLAAVAIFLGNGVVGCIVFYAIQTAIVRRTISKKNS